MDAQFMRYELWWRDQLVLATDKLEDLELLAREYELEDYQVKEATLQ